MLFKMQICFLWFFGEQSIRIFAKFHRACVSTEDVEAVYAIHAQGQPTLYKLRHHLRFVDVVINIL